MASGAASSDTVRTVADLLQKVARVGADPQEILAKANAPFSLSDLAERRVSDVPRRRLLAIYRECIVAIGWHSSRLDGKPQMHPDEFRLMCHCVITCRTLGDVIQRQAMFYRTRAERLSTLELSVEGVTATLALDTLRRRRSFGAFLSDLAGVSIFSRLYAWLIGGEARLFRVGLAYGAPYEDEPVTDFFAGEITFGHAVNQIAFPARLLEAPLVRSPEELDALLAEFPFDFLAARPAELHMAERVRNIYAMALTRGEPAPSLEQMAQMSGQSVSTMRRRLAEEGAAIRELKDVARRDAALVLLAGGRRSIDEIAFRTGFKDADSFRAAFRRWTGETPSRYRAAQRSAVQPGR